MASEEMAEAACRILTEVVAHWIGTQYRLPVLRLCQRLAAGWFAITSDMHCEAGEPCLLTLTAPHVALSPSMASLILVSLPVLMTSCELSSHCVAQHSDREHLYT